MFTFNHLSDIPSRRYVAMFYLNNTDLTFACRYFNTKPMLNYFWLAFGVIVARVY